MADLSAKQIEALAYLLQHGQLIRRPGGFWTWPGCAARTPVLRPRVAPVWYVTGPTVLALVSAGFARITDRRDRDDEPLRVEPA